MGKIIFDNPNQNITFQLYNFKDSRATLNLGPKVTFNTLANPTFNDIGIGGVTEIEVTNGINVAVESEAPLNNIIVRDNSTITLHNNHTGDTKTKIIAEKSSTITQTGTDLPIEKVALYSNAQFNFTHKGSAYSLHNNDINYSTQPSANSGITVNVIETDIHFIAETAIKLNSTIFDFKTLKAYKKQEEILDIFTKQNNLASDININSYIAQNYFKLTGIAKSLEGSNLAILPNEIISQITSWLKLSDVSYKPVLFRTNSHTNEITLDIEKIQVKITGQVENYSE